MRPTLPLPPPVCSAGVTPLSPDRYRLQLTIGGTIEKLRLAKDILRHAIHLGDDAAILDRVLTALLADLARKMFAAACRPRPSRGTVPGSRHTGQLGTDSRSPGPSKTCPPGLRRPSGGILSGMRVKTSVTIDERVLRAIDKATSRNRSRSRVLEDAAREFLARRVRAAREARDLEILNSAADALNREMDDVLAYQADI